MRSDIPPDEETPLSRWPWVEVRFRCHYCARWDDVRLAMLSAKKGHALTVGALVRQWASLCPWHHSNPARKPQKYGMKCGANCPDLRTFTPPDMPPAMGGLVVVEGGKADMLPAEPRRQERRRRIGGEDEG
jgi:hypothetical protein